MSTGLMNLLKKRGNVVIPVMSKDQEDLLGKTGSIMRQGVLQEGKFRQEGLWTRFETAFKPTSHPSVGDTVVMVSKRVDEQKILDEGGNVLVHMSTQAKWVMMKVLEVEGNGGVVLEVMGATEQGGVGDGAVCKLGERFRVPGDLVCVIARERHCTVRSD